MKVSKKILVKVAKNPVGAAKEIASEAKYAHQRMHYARHSQRDVGYERQHAVEDPERHYPDQVRRASHAIAKRHKTMGRREGAAAGLIVGSAVIGDRHAIRGRGSRRH